MDSGNYTVKLLQETEFEVWHLSVNDYVLRTVSGIKLVVWVAIHKFWLRFLLVDINCCT